VPFPDVVTWLQERTALSLLSEEVLSAIAPFVEQRRAPAHQHLVVENKRPVGLYILKSGQLESNKPDRIAQLSPAQTGQTVNLLPGALINFQPLLLDQPTRETVVTQSDCELLFVPAAQFKALVSQYPEISRVFSQQLAQDLAQVSSQLSFEQERAYILRPYLVTKAKRGIVGRSRYAVRLRQEIQQASQERQSVLIFGEPGLEKDNKAALIHFGSPYRREPAINVDCSKLQTSGAELFGRAGGKPGLIEALGEGTLALNNSHELPQELYEPIAELLKTGTYTPVNRPGAPPAQKQTCHARIILISEKTVPALDPLVGRTIKVPPLRVRKADLDDQLRYYINLICRSKGVPKPRITPEALRQLQDYDFPNNLSELANLAERAVVQLQGTTELTEEILWPSRSKQKRLRLNLFNASPSFRRFLRSPWWPDRLNYWVILPLYTLVVVLMFVGPQTRDQNIGLNLFWAWWWPLILLGFPFVGRLWCAICPFMIYGEIAQKLSLWLVPRQLKRWPRQSAEKWGGWFLFGLFALILLWEELWELENTAYLSACLLLLITAGAIIFSAIFERRFWCRYLCPIGGMNGMFAKLSIAELRAQQGTCSAECTTYQCYKGGPAKGEGQETMGCPLYSHPAQMQDNRDCVLCMTCLKACPHRSVELNLRPPGIELWTTHKPRSYEVALMLLLLGAVFLHRLPAVRAQLGLELNLEPFGMHALGAVAALSLPAAIPLLAYGAIRGTYRAVKTLAPNANSIRLKPRPFGELAYGYLPLVLAANLAHYIPYGLGEAGRILPVGFATFGLNGTGLPVAVAHPAVIAFLQALTLIAGVWLSVWLTHKIARQPLRALLPQHVAAFALGSGVWLVVIEAS